MVTTLRATVNYWKKKKQQQLLSLSIHFLPIKNGDVKKKKKNWDVHKNSEIIFKLFHSLALNLTFFYLYKILY